MSTRTTHAARDAAAGAGAAPAAVHHLRTTCRACDGTRLTRFLELGPIALANAFPRSPEEFGAEARYPLDVYLCATCGLVQLLDVIDPEVLFRDYIYVTGTSETIARHNVAYARAVVEDQGLGAGDLVVEAASNDGSLLGCFRAHGVRTLGVEPARNIAELARSRGIETIPEFFGRRTAAAVRASHGPAAAVIGNNVLAHVDDPQDFLGGAASLLAPQGRVIVEVPYLAEFVDRLEYDTVYHEHLCYFSVSALMRLCEAVGLVVVRVDRVPVHGGSIRVQAGLASEHGAHASAVVAMAEAEREAGLVTLPRFERFAADVAAHRAKLVGLLERLRSEGRALAGYGAPAKGNTLLGYCGIGPALIPWTVDRSPHKVGRFTPGTHIPVLPAEALLERMPDYTLILAWNFADEIMAQQSAYRARGGRFILPLPEPVIV